MRWFRVALLIALLAPAPLGAQTPTDPAAAERLLRKLESDLERNRARMTALERQANDLAAEDLTLRRDLIRASQAVQRREADLTALESRLRELDAREADLRARMGDDAQARAAMLSGLVRLARRPALSWADPRRDASDGVRSAIVMRDAVPAIAARADALRADLADLTALRAETEDQRRAAADAARSLESERAAVAALIEQRASKTARTQAERAATAKRLQAIAREEKSIRDLYARLERERVETEKRLREQQVALNIEGPKPARKRVQAVTAGQLRRFPKAAPGAMSAPVAGALARLFGAKDDVGEKTEGVEIRTRPNAQVVAPFDGEIVFADRFGGYGRMLMIRHRGDYISTLAGLGRLDVAVGDLVLEGEPVGVMAKDAAPSLYLELRRKARPIDPKPWLARRNGDGIG